MRRTVILTVTAALLTASCGGDATPEDPTVGGRATCTASGDHTSVAADDLKYDRSCLAVPANQDVTISFDNKEALPHNVVILTDESSSESIFSGAIITGPKKVDYRVKAMAPGTYRFHCSVHPTQMKGTFIVQ